jgi:5'-nucleotidase/UDP-sugar diphosphatase
MAHPPGEPLMRRALLLTLALAPAAGCVAYNESCQAPVDNPTQVVAQLKAGETILLDKPYARHANNAFGQAAAAAFRDAFSGTSAPADVGVVNGGDLRAEGFCSPRTQIKEAVQRGTVHEVLLFDNLVYAVDVTEPELLAALEHSVSPLTAAGKDILSPPARFLQVDGVTFTVDCSQPAGSRVSEVKVGDRSIAAPGNDTQRVRVAMPQFILGGGDGYSMFTALGQDADRNPQQAKKNGGTEARIAADYMVRTYKNDSNGTGPELSVEPRVKFVNCALPAGGI